MRLSSLDETSGHVKRAWSRLVAIESACPSADVGLCLGFVN